MSGRAVDPGTPLTAAASGQPIAPPSAAAAARPTTRPAFAASTRPITVLLLALGGEGGGVLADWVVDTAIALGLPVQGTSVPGVAQRTGATSYYIEMLPVAAAQLGARPPVFCLAPTPGQIDLVVSSELLETARAIERGLPDAGRTVLISSTSRFLTVAEKMQMGDGRVDAARIVEAARAASREALLFDMAEQTQAAGTVVSAVMFGALAASGVLPLPREACEATISRGGGARAAQASLEGFRRGFDAVHGAREASGATASAETSAAADTRAGAPASPAASAASGAATAPAAFAPTPARAGLEQLLALGRARMADFQDRDYARLYDERVGRVVAAEGAAGGEDFAVSRTAARFLALWMAYEDVIRVADLKTRPQRIARIRAEVGARDDEPVIVREFLKPGVEEIAAVLSPSLARRLTAWAQRRGVRALSEGLQVATTSIAGNLMLRSLAWLRPLRRRSSRFALEQALIERWLQALLASLQRGAGERALALEIAECPRLLKGYSDTHARGRRSFETILQTLVEAPLAPAETAADRARAIRRAREAALADPQGRGLAAALGLPPPLEARPIRFVPRQARRP